MTGDNGQRTTNNEAQAGKLEILTYSIVGAEPDREEFHGGLLRQRNDFRDDFERGVAVVAAVERGVSWLV